MSGPSLAPSWGTSEALSACLVFLHRVTQFGHFWNVSPHEKLQYVVNPHVELTMAPHAGFDTDQIKDKSRKDLLYLLEGVGTSRYLCFSRHQLSIHSLGSWKEESGT